MFHCVGPCAGDAIHSSKLDDALLNSEIFYKRSHHFLQNCVPHYKHRQGI